MNLEIKRAKDEDISLIKSLMLLALDTDPTAFTSTSLEFSFATDYWWNEYLGKYTNNDEVSEMQLAFEGEKLVGMIGLLGSKRVRQKHTATIVWFYVLKDYRNIGVGKKLFELIINRAKQREYLKKIYLNVFASQKSAISLYKRNGFEQIGYKKEDLFVNGKYYDSIEMEKFL